MTASYQSGFSKARRTVDPVVCLEDDVRKAEACGWSFFGVEEAFDMLWKEKLLIKLHLIGLTGKIFTTASFPPVPLPPHLNNFMIFQHTIHKIKLNLIKHN